MSTSLILLTLLLACDTTTTATTLYCNLPLPILEPAAATAGESIVATTGPLFTDWDAAVLVGSTRAEVKKVTREDCESCDTCRSDAGCTACGECESCETECSVCVENLTFAVPDLAAGTYQVSVLNQYGRSEAATFELLAADTAPDSTP